jgi:hypothetical protein
LELVYSEEKGANVVKGTTRISSGPAGNEVDISWRKEKNGWRRMKIDLDLCRWMCRLARFLSLWGQTSSLGDS